MHVLVGTDDVLQLVKEPFVDLRQAVNLIHSPAGTHCLGNNKYTVVCRLPKGSLYVRYLQFLVANESMGPLADHPESLLDGLFEAAADGHDLSDRFHGGADLARYSMELAQVPARNLADNIVKSRLEESRGGLGDGVLEVEESVAKSEFGRHECQRITGCLGCQG